MAVPVESILIDPEADGTLQQKIRQRIAEGILAGRYRAGERMPSSRALARHLGVSRITITLAYTDLVADDYLFARGRSGYFVSNTAPAPPPFPPPQPVAAPRVDWARALGQRFAGRPSLSRPEDWQSYPYPFIYGQTDPRLFDHQNWRQCALQALGQRDFRALSLDYYERDDPMLVEYILRHILPRRGIDAQPQDILITMGAQNALWMAAQILLTQRRTAALENPGYPGLREILAQTRCRIETVDVDADGLPPDHLPEGIDALFATVSHHCPTNTTMPLARRKRLLQRASEHGFIIVEDDYEFELSFDRAASPSLKSLDRSGSVVYVGSFSKSLFPGLRLGYLVADAPFIREARALRGLILRHPPGHIQRAVAYFLSLGHYDAQINKMRKAYAKRRTVMEDAIRRTGLQLAAEAGAGGSSFWMRAPDGIDTEDLAKRLRARGVVIEPGHLFFDPDRIEHTAYRLAYSSIAADRIPEGIARIADALAQSGPTRAA